MSAIIEWWSRWGSEVISFYAVVVVLSLALVLALAGLAAKASAGFFSTKADFLEKSSKKYFLHSALVSLCKAGPKLVFALLIVVGSWTASAAFEYAGQRSVLMHSFANLATAWSAIFFVTVLIHDRFWIRVIAFAAYILAGLSIFQFLNPAIEILDSTSFQLGETKISILRMLKTVFLGGVLFWVAGSLSRFLDDKVHQAADLTPSFQELLGKATKVVLFTAATLLAMGITGIDLTGIAIIGGALSVGIGFGLQTVVSNLISGFILLLDRSIKPGDVIEIESTYGVIKNLGARYVSVLTRDGTEHLIPNEMLIKDKVVNWSFSDRNIRIKAPIGISYGCDPHKAIELCMAAAGSVPRVLHNPSPNCLLRGFGDNSVDLELRFWIADPHQGVANITSAVLLKIWDAFKENGIEIPFPQRDLHLKTSSPLRVEMQDIALFRKA